MVTTTAERIHPRVWITVVALGLAGQLAWTVENMYLNVFVYNTITDDPNVIALLVSSSAIAATLATIFVGALSDRVGRRRPFIAIGYVLWGGTTALFGFIQPAHAPGAGAAAHAIGVAVVLVIVVDCVMSIFGAGANDAAFHAWVTDSTTPNTRGRVDSVLAVMPLLAMLVIFAALDPLTQAGQWRLFFGIIGAVTALAGLGAWFFVEDSAVTGPTGGYFAQVIHGMRPSTVRQYPRLYVLFLAYAIIGIATQVFLPFLIIYLQRYLRLDTYPIILGVTLVLASVVSILGGRLIDRLGATRAIIPMTAVLVAGLVLVSFARSTAAVISAGTVMMAGFMLAIAAVSASVRNHTPTDRVGMVQGLRMVAAVAFPMVIGPFIGARLITGSGQYYEELGELRLVPTPSIFLGAAAIAVFTVLPVWWLRRFPGNEGSEPAAALEQERANG